MPKQSSLGYFFEYRQSLTSRFDDVLFYALIMSAMRRADHLNLAKLQAAWPDVWASFQARYKAPGGALTQSELDYLVRIKEAD